MSTDITTIGIAVTSSDVPIATDRLAQLGKQGKDTEDATGKLSSAFDRLGGSTNTLAGYIKIAAEAFAAWKIADFVKDTVLLAARYETLGVVMQVIGNNAGYTGEQMLKFQAGLQKTGISAVEARQGLALMGQAQVDMTKSSQLARVAQDAAVIANTNSSDAFNRMMTGISTGQAIILHHMGLMVNFEKGYKTLGDQLGKTKEEMTTQELTQARVAEVMRVSTGIAGSYEAAMGTVGKAMNSLKRFVDDAKVSFGLLFTPALGFMVEELTGSLKGLGAWFQTNKSSIKEWGNSFKDTIITIAAEVTRLSMLLDKAGGSMTSAGMLLFGPGSALGNAKSKKQFERLAAANMEYEKRYSEGESRLQSMAGKMSDVAPNGGITVDPAEAGRMAAHAARVAEEAAAARKAAAEKAAADALELAQKQAAYQKQLDDAKTALARINAENAKKLDESIMKEKLAGFTYEKEMGLKTTQEFLDAKYALEKETYSKEIKDAEVVRKAAQSTLNGINSNPVTDLLMQIQAQEKLAQATGKLNEAKQKLAGATAELPRLTAVEKNVQDSLTLSMSAQLDTAIGGTIAAVAHNQALEMQTAAYKRLQLAGGEAFAIKQKLMELDRYNAQVTEKNVISNIKLSTPDAYGNTNSFGQRGQVTGDAIGLLDKQMSQNPELKALQRLEDQKTAILEKSRSDQAVIQKKYDDSMLQAQFSAANSAMGIMVTASGNSKGMQLAALAVQTGIAVAQIQIAESVAEARAFAELGYIAGWPAVISLRAMAMTNTALALGAGAISAVQIAGKRAAGGPVDSGSTYLVGEKGPELFTPSASGNITPNNKIVSGGGDANVTQHITIDARGADQGVEQRIRSAMTQAKDQAKAEILTSMNRGGEFALASGRMR